MVEITTFTVTLAPLPISLGVSAAFLAVYVLALVWMLFGVKRAGEESLATLPWSAFILVRIIQLVIGIVAAVTNNSGTASLPTKVQLWHLHTYFYDIGFIFLVLGLWWAVGSVLDLSRGKKWRLTRIITTSVAFLILTASFVFGSYTSVTAAQKVQDGTAIKGEGSLVATALLCTALTLLQLIFLALLGPLVYYVFISHGHRADRFSSADQFSTFTICVTVVLLIARAVPDVIRAWTDTVVSTGLYVGLSLIVEVIIVAAWLACATFISRWDLRRWQEEDVTHRRAAQLWKRNIDEAFEYALAKEENPHRFELMSAYDPNSSWVGLLAAQHFHKILSPPPQLPKSPTGTVPRLLSPSPTPSSPTLIPSQPPTPTSPTFGGSLTPLIGPTGDQNRLSNLSMLSLPVQPSTPTSPISLGFPSNDHRLSNLSMLSLPVQSDERRQSDYLGPLDASTRRQRAEQKRLDLIELASLVATCITLMPCWRDSLLHPSARPLSHEMTEKKVMQTLRARQGKTQSRAELMAEGLTFVFLASLAPDGMGGNDREVYQEVERALENATLDNLILVSRLAILSALRRRDEANGLLPPPSPSVSSPGGGAGWMEGGFAMTLSEKTRMSERELEDQRRKDELEADEMAADDTYRAPPPHKMMM